MFAASLGHARLCFLVKLARQSANQVLNRFADSNLGACGATLLLLDLLQVAMDGCLGACISQLNSDRINGGVAAHGQQPVAGTDRFRLVNSGSAHVKLRYRTVIRNMILHTNLCVDRIKKQTFIAIDNGGLSMVRPFTTGSP